MLSAHLH
jgi:hypothetical protein